MDSADPLSQLADIHLPEQVGFWPPAPGWWVLLALVLAALLFAAFRLLLAWRQRRMCGLALGELDKCFQTWRARLAAAQAGAAAAQAGAEQTEIAARLTLINEVNAVLRRVALRHHPQHVVAGLSGERWVAFLRTHSNAAALDDSLSAALAQGRFAPRCDVDADHLRVFAADWIKGMYLARIDATPPSPELAPEHA
jgi:hypothetical protein